MTEICLLGKPLEVVKASTEFIDEETKKETFKNWHFILFRFEDYITLAAYKSDKSLANEIHDASFSYIDKFDVTDDSEYDVMIKDVMNSFDVEWHLLRYAEINI